MSWLARSLANSLRIDDENDVVSRPNNQPSSLSFSDLGDPSPSSPTGPQPEDHGTEPGNEDKDEDDQDAQTRGVKEDLSEFGHVLSRQLWGVASFLAPPPSDLRQSVSPAWDWRSEPSDRPDPAPEMAWEVREGEEAEEFEEREGDEEEELEERESFVGITEEVLAFARNIAMHPETWLDFPLDEEEELDDFNMSDAQQQHAMVIERLAPRLKALRIELCPCHMSDAYFWIVYFVLLHSRLNKQDAEALSTPQVMAARAKWMQELQNHTTSDSEWFGSRTLSFQDSSDLSHEDHVPVSPSMAHYEDVALGTFPSQPTNFSVTTPFKTERHPVESSELQFVDKSVIEENPIIKTEDKSLTVGSSFNSLAKNNEDEDDDDWLEDDFELNGYVRTSIPTGNEEDISFSDLEDDDFLAPTTKFKVVSKEFETSTENR